MIIRVILICILTFGGYLFGQNINISQQVIASAGMTSVSANMTVCSTTGESIVRTGQSGTLIITQGFHQPENHDTVGINEEPEIDLLVYPNPTMNQVVIEFNINQSGTWHFRLTDMFGKEIFLHEELFVPGKIKYIIPINGASGTYLLEISNERGVKEITKIVKL